MAKAVNQKRNAPDEVVSSQRIVRMRPDDGEDDLLFLYEELEVGKKTRKQLEDAGVVTIEGILQKKDEFKEAKVERIRKVSQQEFYRFCLWHENFYKENDKTVSWRNGFTVDSLDEFVESLSSAKAGAEAIFDVALHMIHEDDQGELKYITKKETDALYAHVAERVMEVLPEALVKGCHFNVTQYIENTARAIFNLPTGKPYQKIQLTAGQTQSGKSNVKAVVQATCDLLRCPLIIITKGVAESKDLSRKFQLNVSAYECNCIAIAVAIIAFFFFLSYQLLRGP